jgi:hypothetical protein
MAEDKIKQLHSLVLDGLITKLKSEDPSTTDYSNAIKFLKDYPSVKPEEEAKRIKQEKFLEDLELPFPCKGE